MSLLPSLCQPFLTGRERVCVLRLQRTLWHFHLRSYRNTIVLPWYLSCFHARSVDFFFHQFKEDIEVVFSVFYLISFNYLLINKTEYPVPAPV